MPFNRKISGLYHEFAVPFWVSVAILVIAGAVIYLPYLGCGKELFRNESLYAVMAQELSDSAPVATAHHVQQVSGEIIFPALASFIHNVTGLAMDSALRCVSLFMLIMTAAVCGVSASGRSAKAGIVASAICLTSLLAIEKGAEGYPTTTNAFFLICAQMTFFYYGIRRANWNLAWIFSTLLITLAFFSGGIRMLLFFIFPMLFFRRPLSVKSKFRTPGFIIAVLIASLAVAGQLLHFSISTGKAPLSELLGASFDTSSYWEDFITYPFALVVRFMPWTAIIWLPFCVALQAISPSQIYSRYLRTLTLSTLLLLWIIPDHDSREFIYLAGPLSIQTGMIYELGMRRYGNRIRRFLVLGEFAFLLVIGAFAAVMFLPESVIGSVISISSSLAFRNAENYNLIIGSALLSCIVLGMCFYFGRRSAPVWMLLLTLSVMYGIFSGSVTAPYQAQDTRKRTLGSDIRNALAKENVDRLYKCDIRGFYGGLFYTGLPVYQLNSVSELPEEATTVYLISTEFPQTTDRSWSNLLPPNYTYQAQKISLWKGVLRETADY